MHHMVRPRRMTAYLDAGIRIAEKRTIGLRNKCDTPVLWCGSIVASMARKWAALVQECGTSGAEIRHIANKHETFTTLDDLMEVVDQSD